MTFRTFTAPSVKRGAGAFTAVGFDAVVVGVVILASGKVYV
jgi:hypothetical protein